MPRKARIGASGRPPKRSWIKNILFQAKGFDLDRVVQRVSDLLGIEPKELWAKENQYSLLDDTNL